MVSGFLVFVFHRRPGNAMRGSFALRGTARCVLRPRIVESAQVDLLRVLR